MESIRITPGVCPKHQRHFSFDYCKTPNEITMHFIGFEKSVNDGRTVDFFYFNGEFQILIFGFSFLMGRFFRFSIFLYFFCIFNIGMVRNWFENCVCGKIEKILSKNGCSINDKENRENQCPFPDCQTSDFQLLSVSRII